MQPARPMNASQPRSPCAHDRLHVLDRVASPVEPSSRLDVRKRTFERPGIFQRCVHAQKCVENVPNRWFEIGSRIRWFETDVHIQEADVAYKKRPGSSGALDACKQTFVQRGECLGASHLLGLEAAGAHVHLAAHTVHDDVHALDVRTELTVGDAVGVADGATSNGVLTADFANFGHVSDPS